MNQSSKPKHKQIALRIFFKHFTRNLTIGFALTLLILSIGIMGYRYFEQIDWIDAYTNSAMIISGVGTLSNPKTVEGKLFLASYSILGGGGFLLVVGVVFAPIFHWFIRMFRVEDREHF